MGQRWWKRMRMRRGDRRRGGGRASGGGWEGKGQNGGRHRGSGGEAGRTTGQEAGGLVYGCEHDKSSSLLYLALVVSVAAETGTWPGTGLG